jgi:hypothetical protein
MEFLLLIAVLVGLLWGAIIAQRGGLLAGATMVLLVGVVLGPHFLSLPGGPMPITLDRLLLAAVVIAYAGLRLYDKGDPKPLALPDVVLFFLMGVLTVNVFTNDWKLNRSQPLSYLVFFWMMPLAIYWVVRQCRITERGFRAVLTCFAVFGVYLAFTSVCEARGYWHWVFPQYIVKSSFTEFLGRGRGPLLNPPGNGILLGMCLACGLLLWPRLGTIGKLALAGGFMPLLLLGMYYTLTRSVWMGAAAVMAVVVGLALPRRCRVPAVIAATLIGGCVVAAKWQSIYAFKRDKNLSAAETADSTTLRPILAYVAWQMFVDQPIMGCGLAHYYDDKDPYLHDRTTELQLEKVRPYVQHNAVLSLMAETGLAGLTGFLLLMLLWTRQAWHMWRNSNAPLWQRQVGLLFLALIAGYWPNAMFHDTTIIPMMNMLVFYSAGVMMSVALSCSTVRVESRVHATAGCATLRLARAAE